MDEDDQDLLIGQLSAENDGNHALYTRILVSSIVIEFPIVAFLIRAIISREAKYTVHFMLLSLLCLIGALYDVSAVGARLQHSPLVPTSLVHGLFSFKLLCVVNGLLLVQFYTGIYRQYGYKNVYMFLVMPLVNYIMMILVRKWHALTAANIQHLYGLRYKFKSA